MKKLLKRFYESLPLKLPIYKILRRFIQLPKKLHAFFYFEGVFDTWIEYKSFKMKNYGYQFHVENELFWGGVKNGWEKESTNLWMKLCKNKSIILDIGANTGYYSLIAKTLLPKSEVFAFEPIPLVYKKLLLNNSLNSFDIKCVELALSNVSGEGKIYPSSLDHVYSVTVNKNLFPDRPAFEVVIKTKRLDSFIEENNIKSVDLIKLDVETFEVEVLTGMGKYLELFKPDMLIEIQTDEIANGISTLIKNIDYVFFNINEKTGIKQVERLGKSDTLNYLICKRQTAIDLKLIYPQLV
jgi:FkbM family methyltransferase